MLMSRQWAMPNAETFSVKPIGDFVQKYMSGVSIDPFSRNKQWATYTNDLNPGTSAAYHMDAVDFLTMLVNDGVQADCVLFDPPYSPRQITECYAAAGLSTSMKTTQNGRLYKECRDAIRKLCKPGSVVLSFGWNSVGMGKLFSIEEIMLVSHGGAHNDTICMAERMTIKQDNLF